MFRDESSLIKLKNILFFAVLFITIVCTAENGMARNWDWDQNHDCVKGKDGTWGKYDYVHDTPETAWQGGFTTKECCEKYCQVCPVYAKTGEYQQTYNDLRIPGIGPGLNISRTYNSLELSTSLFGKSWIFNLGRQLIVAQNRDGEKILVVRLKTGERNYFKELVGGIIERITEYGVSYTLTKNSDGTYTIQNLDGSRHELNADGKIGRIVDRNGNAVIFQYNAVGCLERISNASGNYADIQLGPNGKIANISDSLGRTITYGYDDSGNLISVTDPMGNTTQYVYESNNLLTQIIDPRGNVVASIGYENNDPPRVYTFTEKGETYTIAYFDGRTEKTDSQGNKWTYYFNDVGVIERAVDPLGNETNRQLNKVTAQSVDWEEDANGNRTTYTYDADGNVTSKTNPLWNTWQYTYVARTDWVQTETNPLGIVTSYEYDANGNQTKVIRDFGGASENATAYSYNANGNQISMTDPLGNTTTYEYDANGNLTKITDVLGNATTYTYDIKGNLIRETDALGNTTTYTYDLMGKFLTVTDALGNKTTFTYDANGNRTSETDANGNTITYTYDAWHRLVQVSNALGNTTTYAYDSEDNVISVTDGNGNMTKYTYDPPSRLIRETNALGYQTNYTYDAAGNILSITDGCGNSTTFTYDAKNRKVSETDAAGKTTTYTYDSLGNLLSPTLPNGNTMTRVYDSLGRLAALSDDFGLLISYTYDVRNRLVAKTDALGNITAYTYDGSSSIVQTIDPLGSTTEYVYDALGRLLKITDREGNKTSYAYDALGRKISEADKLGNTTIFSYDNVGNLGSVTDAHGNTTGYVYDVAKQLIAETYTDGKTLFFTYDAVGNVVSRTDQNGHVTVYEYDALNRRTKVDYPGTNDSMCTYDCAGNMVTANNSNTTISLTYDKIYRLTQSVQNGQMVAYSYDIAVGTKNITYPGGKVVKEIRNVRGLLTSAEDASAQPIVQYAYDAAGRVQTKTYPNGVVGNSNHNANGWITELAYDKGGSQILGFQYGFDNVGNRLYARKLHDTSNSEQYIYDAKHRLVQFKRGTLDTGGTIPSPMTQTAYNLDALSNWISKTTDGVTQNRTHNNMNELVGIGGLPLTYDDNGNLTDDSTNTYEYDYENRLVKVTRKSDSTILGQYEYDALGRRTEKQAGGVTIVYFYDEIHRVIEEQVSSATEATYVYGSGIDEVASMERNGQTYFHLIDSLGSVVALTDEAGSVIETYDYDAYGSSSNNQSIYGNYYRYTGKLFDQETQIYFWRARHYDPRIGRFLQRDPAGHVDSVNLYEYCRSNPVNLLDAWGLWTKQGILEILCCWMKDKHVVNVLNGTGVSPFTGGKKTYKRYKKNPDGSRGAYLRTFSTQTQGSFNPCGSKISLWKNIPDQKAASTLFHESIHAGQSIPCGGGLTPDQMISYEYPAWIEEEKYNIRHGLPEKYPGFRRTQGDQVVPNEPVIKKKVDDIYKTAYGAQRDDYEDVLIGRVPISYLPEITSWSCSGILGN